MIITKQKKFSDLMRSLENYDKVFIVGCTLCATTCKTGGEDQVRELQTLLEREGKKITGTVVLDPACNILEVKRMYRKYLKEIDASGIILSLACGGGTQALLEVIERKEVMPGNDTLFQGEITSLSLKKSQFSQKCSLCGECMLWETGGICPVTRCPKGLVNGPCGGVKNGKCEVDSDLDCVWILIYSRLKDLGRLGEMKKIKLPKDNTKRKNPQNLIVE